MSTTQANFPTLDGKVAIVTGASRGLGEGFAYELARRGAKVRSFAAPPETPWAVVLSRAGLLTGANADGA
jgi:NAD(P)-dependent dehydrogenase (short-subunit alcohol dehydrogenase family)